MKLSAISPVCVQHGPIGFTGQAKETKARFAPYIALGLLYAGMAGSYFTEEQSPPYAITLIHSASGPPRILKPDEKFNNVLKLKRLHVYSFAPSPTIGRHVSATSRDGRKVDLNLLYCWQLYPATAQTALTWDSKLQQEIPKALQEATHPPTVELTAWHGWSPPEGRINSPIMTPNQLINDYFIAPRIQAALDTYAQSRTQAQIAQESAQNVQGLEGILFNTGFRDKHGVLHPPLRKVFAPLEIRFLKLDHY